MTWLRVGDGGCRGGGFTVGGRTGGGCIGGGCEAKGMGKGSTGAVAGMVEGDIIGKGSSGAVAGAIVGKGTGKGSTGAATSGARSSAEAMFTSEGRYGSPLEENEWPAVGGVSSGAAGLGSGRARSRSLGQRQGINGPIGGWRGNGVRHGFTDSRSCCSDSGGGGGGGSDGGGGGVLWSRRRGHAIAPHPKRKCTDRGARQEGAGHDDLITALRQLPRVIGREEGVNGGRLHHLRARLSRPRSSATAVSHSRSGKGRDKMF